MHKRTARNISTILVGLAAIFAILPLFGCFKDNMNAVFFTVFLCLVNAALITALAQKGGGGAKKE